MQRIYIIEKGLTKTVNHVIDVAMKHVRKRREPPQRFELEHRFRIERLAAGLSLAELATKLHVTKGYLSRLERGKARPSARMIQNIAKVVGTDPAPLHILAGYLPTDVKQILHRHPVEAPAVLREAFAPYGNDVKAQAKRTKILQPADAISTAARAQTQLGNLYEIVHGDCFDWMKRRAPNSIHAVVTDPPYGLKEYTPEEKTKLRRGYGGVWRIPPTFDGCKRSPLPRFTVLNDKDKIALRNFFALWSKMAFRVLVPGGHVFIATNPLVSHLVYTALIGAGFEKRGEVVRLVQTLRGGDRPKNAHEEFDGVTVMPRSSWEPWGLFRKPCEGRVQDNLRKWKTGGLRRVSNEQPFFDVIRSAPTRSAERKISPHPSLKPQAFIRQLVRAALPLGEGIVLDPFLGGGSTVAAACAVGYRSIGIESDLEFYKIARQAIPRLAVLVPNGPGKAMSTKPVSIKNTPQTLLNP